MIGTLLEKLFVAVGVDFDELKSGLGEVSRDVDRMSRDLKRDFESVGKSWQATGQKMMKTGAVMTASITAPLVLFGKHAAQAAIDAEEMDSAFGVVFGNMADDMRKWAEETGNAMGRSTQEIQRGALAFQELFGKALEPEKAAEMSKQFAVLTQDLASFKNLSNEVAQQKLFSGLTGEAEPLRAVGVFINEAAVQSKLLELGLEKVNGKFTDQQKIIARAAIIREQLAQADGDVLRTADSTANRIRASQAAFEELSITVGTTLIPAITPLINIIADLLEGFNNLPSGVQTAIVAVGGIAAIAGPLVTVFGGLVSVAGMVLPTLMGMVPGIAAAGGGFAGLMAVLAPALPIIAAIAAAGALIYANWDKIEPVLSELWNTAKEVLGPPIRELITTLKDTLSDLWNGPLGEGIRAAVSMLWEFQKAYARVMGPVLIGIIKVVIEIITRLVKIIGEGIKFVVALLTGDWAGAWKAVQNIVELTSGAVIRAVASLFQGVKTWLMDRLAAVFSWLKGKLEAVGAWFYDLYDSVVGHSYIPDMVSRIGEEMAKLKRLMVDPAEKATKQTKEAFRELAADTAQIFDRLFPDAAAIRDIRTEMETIQKALKAGQISPDAAASATSMLENEIAAIRAQQAGPAAGTMGIVDSLLPQQARIREIKEDMAKLDEAIAAGRGDIELFRKARAELDVEMEKATRWPLADDLRNLTDRLLPARAEVAALTEDMNLLNAALAAGEIDPARYEEAKAALMDAMDTAEEALRRQTLMASEMGRMVLEAEQFGRDLGNELMGTIRSVLTGQKGPWEALRDGLSRVLSQAINASISALETSIFGKEGFGGFLANAFGSMISGGARAVGGPALPGRIYNVGTGEPFVPSSHGRILSRTDAMKAVAEASGGMGGVRFGDVVVHVSGEMSDRDRRRTALQTGRAVRNELAKVARTQ